VNIFGNTVIDTVLTAVIVLAGLYILLVAALFIFQSRLLFFPGHDISFTPADIGLEYEDITFKTSDGLCLNGWLIPGREQEDIVLFCHGNAGNISDRLESIRIFHNLGLSTFIFDYHGYGKSEGKPSESGTYLDIEAAWNFLLEKRNFLPENIIIFGRSLGSAPAVWLAKDVSPKMLILESAFTSVADIAAELYPFLPVRLLCRIDYNNLKRIRSVSCPVLIIHSPRDELIPYSHGRKLFEAANEPKEFLQISGSHNDGFLVSGSQYVEGIRNFHVQHSKH